MTAKSYQEKYTIMKPATRTYNSTMAAFFITVASYNHSTEKRLKGLKISTSACIKDRLNCTANIAISC